MGPIQTRAVHGLSQIEAPPLSCGKGPEESYRLTWIHAFSSTRPVVVTLERSGRAWSAVGVELTGFVEKTVARRTSRRLSNEEAATLARTLESTAFWNTRVALDPEGAIDGDTWVIEGRHGKAYHVVRRWERTRWASDARNDVRPISRFAASAIHAGWSRVISVSILRACETLHASASKPQTLDGGHAAKLNPRVLWQTRNTRNS